MRFLRRTFRILIWLTGSIVMLAMLLVGGALIWLSSSEPQIDGEIVLASPQAPVTVLRDARGIVHIRADNEADAYYALGFVHAQDRFPQMEQMRRLGAGRLSEIVAIDSVVDLDRFARTLGLYRLAEQTYETASPELKATLDAYAAGVNGYLATHEGAWSPAMYMRLPPSFDLDSYRPEPWRPADSLVWGKLMAIFLAGWNFSYEIERMRVERVLGPALTSEYYPDLPESEYGPTLPVWDQAALDADADWQAAAADIPPLFRTPWDASNAWVVDGSMTASGMPLLANDPHLRHGLPGTWYMVHIKTPTMDLVGGTTPGVPFHILGHNGHIAWGFTTTHSDMADTFIERLNPDDTAQYQTPNGWAAVETRAETLAIAGGDSLTFTVRQTRHGPVISDLRPDDAADVLAEGEILALSAPYLLPDDTTAEGMLRLNRATDWASFREAARLFVAPQQNMHYGDTAGNIGFIAPARVPIRAGGDGRAPAPGWSGAFDWVGWIPFDDLPQAFNPPAHSIVNANNRVVGDDYPYFLGSTYDFPYRSDRIHQMLDGADALTAADFRAMQHDVLSLEARQLLPLMLDGEFRDPRAQAAAARLAAWDGRMTADAAEPLIYEAWARELNRTIPADELGAIFPDVFSRKPDFVAAVLTEMPHWCDDVTTDSVEDCDAMRERSLLAALDFLAARYGDDPAQWAWGEAHRANFRHQAIGRIPLLGDWLDASVPTGGSWATVMRGGTPFGNDDDPFLNVHGAGLRAVYDLGDLDQSVFSMAPGQSDNPYSPYWSNLAQPWADGEYWPIPTSWAQAEDNAVATLILRPGG
ncbi:MAG: penicillin acylase family protein [Alphaproteobacteria bacterium]